MAYDEKGAFTGAIQRRLGRFELAEGGTIFLDEIGELPPETQIALLRVLQEREFERVGGNRSIKADVRLVVATNRDLHAAMADATFRSDLFYRLNVFPIEIPPLRERKEDVPLLVEYFTDRYASKAGKNIRSVSKKSLDLFQSTHGPETFANCKMLLGAQSSFPKAKVSRSTRVGYRADRCAPRQRTSVSFNKGFPLRRNNRLKWLSRSPADEFSVL